MSSEGLSVAMVGVGGFGRQTLDALLRSPAVRVVGVADKDPVTAEAVGSEISVPAYFDNRSLLVETRPEAVYISVPPMAAAELIPVCAERGIHVWKDMPLARNLAEGVAMVRLMAKAKLKLAVGTQRRFAAGYRRAWELRRHLGDIFLARAHYLFNWGSELGWRGDAASAGGGALLELGYHAIDLLVWLLGMPEEVYGINAGGNRPAASAGEDTAQPIYDTDDTAAAVMRYTSGLMASVVTTRSSGPISEELCLHGRSGSLRADGETCVMRDPDGNTLDHTHDDPEAVGVFRRQADAFAHAVLSEATTYECSGLENLLDLAVIEAIYLSDRTAQAESPLRLLRTHGLTTEECLALRPVVEEAACLDGQ
ncbi:MAG: Gfo/Idh/MocA family oxidoreductase [Planctomycetes bacterium]|nr:Gfo/Idh/MocA family oxidoreductase [Planctomycetota bacterium]